ncbi:putative membrane protein [Helicobacter pylori NQ4161]|nr:putative membrane protein [Helicobacter pylori NQ4161]
MLKAKEYYLTKELLLLSFERLSLFFLFLLLDFSFFLILV